MRAPQAVASGDDDVDGGGGEESRVEDRLCTPLSCDHKHAKVQAREGASTRRCKHAKVQAHEGASTRRCKHAKAQAHEGASTRRRKRTQNSLCAEIAQIAHNEEMGAQSRCTQWEQVIETSGNRCSWGSSRARILARKFNTASGHMREWKKRTTRWEAVNVGGDKLVW